CARDGTWGFDYW
nr:immunoglobulin heavy chain junction region [Mus musculus]